MSEVSPGTHNGDLRHAAAIIALAIVMVGAAALLYFLIDILLILFLGIVVAAALQPGHVWLSRWGVPKGLAVLLIYLVLLVSLVLIAVLVGPVLFAQLTTLTASVPEQYSTLVTSLQTSPTPLLQRLGSSLPPFSVLTQNLAALTPRFFADLVAFMTSTVRFCAYFVVVLAIGFYWTIEVPRLERLVLSFLPVARRPQALAIWQEIEYKLGAFVRGQGLAMLIIGVASAIGYLLIGLPNVLVVAVLAGLLEAMPIIGPIVTAVLAALLAVPQGVTSVFLVLAFSTLLQQVESNVLIPRIMSHAIGISSLAGLFAVLIFGTLYGFLGAFVAIPLTVVVHVLLDHLIINPEPEPETPTFTAPLLGALLARLQALRQRLRLRSRERDSRLGGNPQTAEHRADSFDQRIEQAVERVETIITTTQEDATAMTSEERAAIMTEVQQATQTMEHAVEQTDTALPTAQSEDQGKEPATEAPGVEELHQATQQVEQAVQRAGTVLTEAQEDDEKTQGETQSDTNHKHPR
jgi:predicted PurR-regulated permease PerM